MKLLTPEMVRAILAGKAPDVCIALSEKGVAEAQRAHIEQMQTSILSNFYAIQKIIKIILKLSAK